MSMTELDWVSECHESPRYAAGRIMEMQKRIAELEAQVAELEVELETALETYEKAGTIMAEGLYACHEKNKALREVVEIVRELVGDYTITDKRLIKALESTNET